MATKGGEGATCETYIRVHCSHALKDAAKTAAKATAERMALTNPDRYYSEFVRRAIRTAVRRAGVDLVE